MTSVVLYANVEALRVRRKTLFGWEPNLQIANTPKDTILLAMKYVITYLRFFWFFFFFVHPRHLHSILQKILKIMKARSSRAAYGRYLC